MAFKNTLENRAFALTLLALNLKSVVFGQVTELRFLQKENKRL